MPPFKRVEFIAKNAAGAVDKFTVQVEVSSSGAFYAHVPDKLRVSLDEDLIDRLPRQRGRAGFVLVSAITFSELFGIIKKAHNQFMEPAVKKEKVIRYNIESHVSFALTKDGRIFPNAGYPGAEWASHGDETYGNHDACRSAKNGYSLTIGAKAMVKKTTTYGEKSASEYSYYYGEDDDQFSRTDPAARLNSWSAMVLPEDAREMPYSEEAAVFFFGLLQTMAELNRRVQEFTNTPEKLSLAIAKTSGVLMLSAPAPLNISIKRPGAEK